MDRKAGGLVMTEIAPGVEVEEVRAKTGAPFTVADNVKVMG